MNQSNHKTDLEIFKDIENGIYKDYYLIYNRKSTDDDNNQKNSLKYQRSENERFALREQLPLAQLCLEGFCRDGIISEKHSAFKTDEKMIITDEGTVQFTIERPKFHRLVNYLNRSLFKGVIFLCWDRASRNEGDETVIKKLIRVGVDIRFTLTKYEKTSSGELHMDVDGMFSKHHSRVTKEKVSLTFKKKRREGICTYKAPVGYLNQGKMEWKPIDPIRGPIIQQLFELAGSDEKWSLADLAKWATEHGFTMNPAKRPRTKEEMLMEEEEDDINLGLEAVARPAKYTTIQKILQNYAYTGKMRDKDSGEWVQTISYDPLISEELFFRVQRNLRSRHKSKKYDAPLSHPFRRMIYCGDCNRVYTPYPQKGIMYYGCRCKEGCVNENNSVNFSFISDHIGALIRTLHYTEDELALFDARTSTAIALLENRRHTEIHTKEKKKEKLREDLAYLRANKLTLLQTKVYTPEAMFLEETQLEEQIRTLITEEEISEIAMCETMKDIVKLSELLKNAGIYWDFANSSEKEAVTKIIFSELTISGKTFNYKVNEGFKAFETRFVSECDLTVWLLELTTNRIQIRNSIAQLSNYQKPS